MGVFKGGLKSIKIELKACNVSVTGVNSVGLEGIQYTGSQSRTPQVSFKDGALVITEKPAAGGRKGLAVSNMSLDIKISKDADLRFLDIKLNPLDDAYLVRITDKTGKAVYEKAINAGNIVALNIDISAYEEGQYTITIENSNEVFTGQFDTLASVIKDIQNTPNRGGDGGALFNLQGQRINTLQKGLNIVDGKKVWVK